MARGFLQNLDEWELVYKEQDLRGRDAYDDAGRRLGKVVEMIGDTDEERIVSVVLDSGQTIPTVLIDDRLEPTRILVHSAAAESLGAPHGDEPSVLERAGAAVSGAAAAVADTAEDAWDEAKHAASEAGETVEDAWDAAKGKVEDALDGPDHDATAGVAGASALAAGAALAASADGEADAWSLEEPSVKTWHARNLPGSTYDEYAPFYKYGFDSGRRDAYVGRDWDSLEGDMRADYESRYGVGTWERVCGSVYEGFRRARGIDAADDVVVIIPPTAGSDANAGAEAEGDIDVEIGTDDGAGEVTASGAPVENDSIPTASDEPVDGSASGSVGAAAALGLAGAAAAASGGDDAADGSGNAEPSAPAKRTGWYELYIADNGEHAFVLKAANGQVILDSETYTSRAGAENGIASVQKNAPLPERYERFVSEGGKPMFNLKAGNHQVIGTSEEYESEASRENGIQSVMRNGPSETIKDKTAA